jgi:DNA primase
MAKNKEGSREPGPGPCSLPSLNRPDLDDATILSRIVSFYARTLQEDEKGLRYLRERGLDPALCADRFHLGFANRTLGCGLPPGRTRQGRELRDRLCRLGLVRKSGHEQLAGSLVIPVFGPEGDVVQLYGRKITHGLRSGTPLHLYLPGPRRGVWNEAGLVRSPEIVLCESLIDALTFWCVGLRHVTASFGPDGFTKDHWSALGRHGTARVLIAYDRDDEGERSAAALAKELTGGGIECFRVRFPRGMDANDYLRAEGGEGLARLIRAAAWMGRGPSPGRSSRTSATTSPNPGSRPPSPIPPPLAEPVPVEVGDREVRMALRSGSYRVRGLEANRSLGSLRVSLIVRGADGGFHADTLDLYSARHRDGFARIAAPALCVHEALVRKDLGLLLLELEGRHPERTRKLEQPRGDPVRPSDAERREALEFLESPDLLEVVRSDLGRIGMEGESLNGVVAYLAATSRKLERPLALLIQGSVVGGKGTLMNAVLSLMPDAERLECAGLSSRCLRRLEEQSLRHKLLVIRDLGGTASVASALRMIEGRGQVSVAEGAGGVRGWPWVGQAGSRPATFLSTTAVGLDEALVGRFLVLAVDEGERQTRRIHRAQRGRRTLGALLGATERARIVTKHRVAQHLLRPLPVVNPYAERLTFPDSALRSRSDHERYLTLIDVVAFLHQYQDRVRRARCGGRELEYVEVAPRDVAVANRLAARLLAPSRDELAPHTRRFLTLLTRWTQRRAAETGDSRRFGAREAREALGMGATQTRLHLARLVELEYVLARGGGRQGRTITYELASGSESEHERPHLLGLTDPEALDDPLRP